jgi:hypothetical protein
MYNPLASSLGIWGRHCNTWWHRKSLFGGDDVEENCGGFGWVLSIKGCDLSRQMWLGQFRVYKGTTWGWKKSSATIRKCARIVWVQIFDGELLVSAELYVTSRYKLSIAQDVPGERWSPKHMYGGRFCTRNELVHHNLILLFVLRSFAGWSLTIKTLIVSPKTDPMDLVLTPHARKDKLSDIPLSGTYCDRSVVRYRTVLSWAL